VPFRLSLLGLDGPRAADSSRLRRIRGSLIIGELMVELMAKRERSAAAKSALATVRTAQAELANQKGVTTKPSAEVSSLSCEAGVS